MPFSKDKKGKPKKERPKDRFTSTSDNIGVLGGRGRAFIVKDEVTGVSYLAIRDTDTGIGLTPLLDPNGKPIIDPIS